MQTPKIRSLDGYTADARVLIARAQRLADSMGHQHVQVLHVLATGLEEDPGWAVVFGAAGVDVVALKRLTIQTLDSLDKGSTDRATPDRATLSMSLQSLLDGAESPSAALGLRLAENPEVDMEALLDAITRSKEAPVQQVLQAFRLGPGSLRGFTRQLHSVPRLLATVGDAKQIQELTTSTGPTLRSSQPLVGRAAELTRSLTILERLGSRHLVVVGEPGTGRTSLIEEVARKLAAGDAPSSLCEAQLLRLEPGSLLAGVRIPAELRSRVQELLRKWGKAPSPTLVLLPSIERLLERSPAGPGLGEVFADALGFGGLHLMATTTPEGWALLQTRDPALAQRLTPLMLEEPSVELATEMIRARAGSLNEHHQVALSEGALSTASRLAKRYLADRALPQSALDLLDEAAAAARVAADALDQGAAAQLQRYETATAQLATLNGATDQQSAQKTAELTQEIEKLEPAVTALRETVQARRGGMAAARTLLAELDQARQDRDAAVQAKDYAKAGKLEHEVIVELEARLQTAKERAGGELPAAGVVQVDEQQVADTVARWTGVPVSKMLEGEAEKLQRMEQRLKERVVGQAEAVEAVTRAIRRSRVGLRDPGRPIGSFLFLGTSGVGKTELAKALAEFLFDSKTALTRIDMSEFMERHMAQRLVGAPPGYAGSEDGGVLTEAVRRRPYSVLLFDEVEKAHQDVFNLLLQVLDDGRLTDGRGRTVDFTNTVVILTSNIGANELIEPGGPGSKRSKEDQQQLLNKRLGEFFRPEFLNRIGEQVVFSPLGKPELSEILNIQLRQLQGLVTDRRLALTLSPSARKELVQLSFEPHLGARPLQRQLVRHLQDPLAEALLSGSASDGDKVELDHDGSSFSFEVHRETESSDSI